MGKRLPFLIAAILLGLLGGACTGGSAQPAAARLPQATVATLTGEPADLATVVRGKVALVSLWATWCEACVKEIDALNRLSARTAARGDGVVVAVAIGEPRAEIVAFTRKRGLLYAQLVDEEFILADALGQRRVPTTLVIDRAGRIVYRGDALDPASLDAFRRALAGE